MSTNTYLITGVPGSGKTTIGESLGYLGHDLIDGDNYPGLVVWVDKHTRQPSNRSDYDSNEDWLANNKHIWDKDVLQRIMEESANGAIVYGTTSNQVELFGMFARVFMLKVDDPDLIDKRLSTPRPNNSFGLDKTDREYVLSWYEACQEHYESNGAYVIDASLPVQHISWLIASIIKQENSNSEPAEAPLIPIQRTAILDDTAAATCA